MNLLLHCSLSKNFRCYFAKISVVFGFLLAVMNNAGAQKNHWSARTASGGITTDKAISRPNFPKEFKLFDINLSSLKKELFSVVDNRSAHAVLIALPNADGNVETFEVTEASNFEPALQAQFPEIRAFSGRGITDKAATLKLSVSPQGIQTMVFRADKEAEFMEPYSQDHKIYAVYKSSKAPRSVPWTCTTEDKKMATDIETTLNNTGSTARSGGDLRTLRLAVSATAEYSNYFGATDASQLGLVLAGINATLTRCNGVFEKDLAVHLNLITNISQVVYYWPALDPYNPNSGGTWNQQVQAVLTANIGEANYDIGHLFGVSGSGGGNAGDIGTICVNGLKGSAYSFCFNYTPTGDDFDIDIVAHEIGHQLGANHTFSHISESHGTNKETASGITIMGYASFQTPNIAAHSIPYFHQASIAQIQATLLTKTCPVTTVINNATPVVNAGANYIIPISTPFALTGSATDANPGNVLTYSWEQNNNVGAGETGANSIASPTKLIGPNWTSLAPTTSPVRYCPKLETILAGGLVSGPLAGGSPGANSEALSSVARTLNFRLTVRDNAPYSSTAPVSVGQTQFSDMQVTVSATSGPFAITAPNTAVSWIAGTTQTVTWSVANTTAAPVSCANVKISLSTDGGLSFPITILASTPNDGSQSITVPLVSTTTARIKVEAVGNIFFDINNSNFTICSGSIGIVTYSNLQLCDGDAAFKVLAAPQPSVFNYSGNLTVGSTGATSYSWVLPPGGSANGWSFTGSGASVTVSTKQANSNLTLRATATNACGSVFKNYYFTSGACAISRSAAPAYTIQPNPATNSFSVISEQDNRGSIRQVIIKNRLGAIVQQVSFNNNNTQQSINIQNLRPDFYFVHISDGINWYSQKMIKQ